MRYLFFLWCLAPTSGLIGQDTTDNPFDLYPRAEVERVQATAATVTESSDGGVIFVHLLLMVVAASLWVLFRDLIGQCMSAVLNDSVMVQLYRRRSGGKMGALSLCYILFFLTAGFYLYLFLSAYGNDPGPGVWGGWGLASLGVAAAWMIKIFVLRLLGNIYPVREEASRYIFALMVFSILTGFLLLPINLLVSYAPEPWRIPFLLGGLAVLVMIYLLHLLRGLVIANHYLGRRPLHFLLYICTIEIAPVLLIYRYLSNSV